MAEFNPLEAVSLVLYGILGIACGVSVVFSLSEADVNRYRIQQWFHLFLSSFVIVRLLWFALKAAGVTEYVTFVLNRLGFSLFFTAFTIVLFYWVENYHKTYVTSHEFLPRFFWVFVACNSIMYVYETVLVVLFLTVSNGKEAGDFIYDLSVYTIIALSFAVSITFFIYGFRLWIRHKFAKDFENATRSTDLAKGFLCTLVIVFCFLVRGAAFLYRPISHKLMDDEAFLALGYFIPELIPSFVEFYVIRAIKQQDQQQSEFIEGLYRDEENLRESNHLPLETLSPKLPSSTLASAPSSPTLISNSSGPAQSEASPLLKH